MSTLLAIASALPWVLAPLAALWRARDSRTLQQVSDTPASDAPLVSVVIPARNERRNIERCVRSVLAARYPRVEVLVVDDQSDDGTGEVAAGIAREDPRCRVLRTAPLPDGWMGKQWACATGAREARGELLLFADADTAHAPDLVARAVNAMRAWGADLLSVAGWQELGSFWERVVQPQIFSVLFVRYGGTEGVNRATRAEDTIANGQCILITREAYERVGGHAAVRDMVAEDLMLAQTVHRAGRRVMLAMGTEQLRTRMYTSLRELVHGWGKNIYAGGRGSLPVPGVLGDVLHPLLLVLAPLMGLAPPVLLLLGLAGVLPSAVMLWAGIATGATVLWYLAVYHWQREPFWYALLYPLGSAVFLAIAVRAITRGRRVAWKGREYRTA